MTAPRRPLGQSIVQEQKRPPVRTGGLFENSGARQALTRTGELQVLLEL